MFSLRLVCFVPVSCLSEFSLVTLIWHSVQLFSKCFSRVFVIKRLFIFISLSSFKFVFNYIALLKTANRADQTAEQ